jgi:hypothetical protein
MSRRQSEEFSPEPLEHGSDVRLKRDVETMQAGASLPLYAFKYLDDDTEYVGVMAQDVLKVRPDAVSTGPDGFYRVNYAKLGIRMVTRAEWDASHDNALRSPEPPEKDSDIRLKRDVKVVGRVSPEPPVKDEVSDIRLKRDVKVVGRVSPEPPEKSSDIRLKRDIRLVGHVSPEPLDE